MPLCSADCINYRGNITLANYVQNFSSILLSRLIPYAEEIIGKERGFRRNMSTTDPILCFLQILEKKRECNKAVCQVFTDFKKDYESVRRKVLYNILIELDISLILARLIKMCQNETHSRLRVGKH